MGVGVWIVGICEIIGVLGEVFIIILYYKVLIDVDEGDLDLWYIIIC